MPLGSNTRSPAGPHRRHRLLIAGAIVLAVAVLLILPAYLTTRAGFFSRYPALTEKYGPWSESTHTEAGCEGCHVAPGLSSRATYRVRMVGEFYLSLVSPSHVPPVFSPPTNEACLVCHSDLRSVSPAGDLQIPHRAHVSVLKMRCVECHEFLVHETNPSGTHTPTMEGCLRCHDGDTAKNNCTACHTEKAAPESHGTSDWLIAHGAHSADPECAACHGWKPDWCVDCHSVPPQSHGTDWRAVHGSRIKEHRGCEACHEAAFCVQCHGEVPALNRDPALGLVK
ncbi:MAG: cytochrome c3 family protein [Coriobacteriia bacterium]